MPIRTVHLTNAFHSRSGGISTFYLAMVGGITSNANQGNAWLAEPQPATFASAVRQALADDAGRQAGLSTAAAHSWDREAEEKPAPFAVSTPATGGQTW